METVTISYGPEDNRVETMLAHQDPERLTLDWIKYCFGLWHILKPGNYKLEEFADWLCFRAGFRRISVINTQRIDLGEL